MANPHRCRLTVLISGNGSNLQALIDACKDETLPNVDIVRVVSNRKAAHGLERAEKAKINTHYHNLLKYSKDYPPSDPKEKYSLEARAAYDADLAGLVLKDQPDLVCCAGFMHILSPSFLNPLANASVPVINLHPSLPGQILGAGAIGRAYEAFQAGEIEKTGAMIHYVIEEVDKGTPITFEEIDLRAGETLGQLEDRFHQVEQRLIVEGTKLAIAKLQPI